MLRDAIKKLLDEWEAKAESTPTKADDNLVKIIRFVIDLFL